MIDPISIMMTVASMASSMMAAQQQQRAQQAAAQQRMNEAAKEQWKAYEAAEKKRKEDLKRSLAAKRARMGAAGLSSVDGSAGAIIRGLRNDKAEATYENYSNIHEALSEQQQSLTSNLMEASDARQRSLYQKAGSAVEGLTGINGVSSLVNFATSETKDPTDLVRGASGVAQSLSNRFDKEQ